MYILKRLESNILGKFLAVKFAAHLHTRRLEIEFFGKFLAVKFAHLNTSLSWHQHFWEIYFSSKNFWLLEVASSLRPLIPRSVSDWGPQLMTAL